MEDIESRAFSQIPGGRQGFDDSHAEIGLAAALAQTRFSDALDQLGAPGAARWDPIAGEVELRGETFRAEQVGSFDGESWLWSWANPFLEIPKERTTVSRGLRDSAAKLGVPAFAVPMIAGEALATCERLNALAGAVVYDFLLQALYSDG